MRTKLTKKLLDSLKPESRLYLVDTELKGFVAMIHPGGTITFSAEYRAPPGGRSAPKRRYKIGVLGKDVTVDEARREASRILGMVRGGADPAADRAECRSRAMTTFGGMVETYVELQLRPRLRTWKAVEAALNKIAPLLGGQDITTISRRDIAQALDEAAKRGPIAANRTFAYLRSFFRWAVERGHIEINPLADVRRPSPEVSRDRVLDDDELREVWKAIETLGAPWEALFKLLVLTGQRRAEVAGMAWTELENLDSDRPIWRIPAERAKNKREHVLPLPSTAANLLKAVPRTSPLVFSTTGTTPVSGFGRVKERLDLSIDTSRKKAANESGSEFRPMRPWVLHDLRRSCASGLGRLGFAPHAIEAVLNHVSGTRAGVAGVYNRHRYEEEIRTALAAWDAHLVTLLGGDGTSNVVALRR